MTYKRIGEAKGPFIVWLFCISYFALLNLFSGSSSAGTLPEALTIPLVLNLLIAVTRSYVAILVFLAVFLVVWEKRRSLREVFSSVGLRKTGSRKSVFWSFALFPVFVLIGLMGMMLGFFSGLALVPVSNNGQFPTWYLWYMVIYAFFPVAVVEEMWARGYMLDRLMPQHPCSFAEALPALLVGSLLFTFWHLPRYMMASLPIHWIAGILAGNVFPISFVLGLAYIRAGTRNIAGPVLIHFLLDSMPAIIALT